MWEVAVINTKFGVSNLKYLDKDGNEYDMTSVKELDIGVDASNEESKNINEIFLINDGTLSFDITDVPLKKYHRKRKGKRYLTYYYEEYSLFDDFKNKVFGTKIKSKKYRKLGSTICNKTK